jgi:hypothetical protein
VQCIGVAAPVASPVFGPPVYCAGDFNRDGLVNVTDLFRMIDAWGEPNDSWYDLTDDNEVNVSDLLELIDNWGDCN